RISRDLETICLKCLEKQPGARYASAAALAEDLDRFCADRPIRARPISATNRAWRWSRRNPVLASLSASTLFLLIVMGALFPLRREMTKPARSLATAVDKSIAVLPFENLSEEKANAFFTEGVQDEILTYLARIADLKVISRTSVMQYKSGAPRNLREIGQQLGVAHVVEGSVQRAANKVRVNAQLIDARTDAHQWAQTYDRDLADVFAIQ